VRKAQEALITSFSTAFRKRYATECEFYLEQASFRDRHKYAIDALIHLRELQKEFVEPSASSLE
jgi:hypothetical protein